MISFRLTIFPLCHGRTLVEWIEIFPQQNATHLAECLPKIVRQKRVQHRINARIGVRQNVRYDLNDDAGVCNFVHVEGLQHQNDLRMEWKDGIELVSVGDFPPVQDIKRAFCEL